MAHGGDSYQYMKPTYVVVLTGMEGQLQGRFSWDKEVRARFSLPAPTRKGSDPLLFSLFWRTEGSVVHAMAIVIGRMVLEVTVGVPLFCSLKK